MLVSLSIIKKLTQKTLAATDLILNCDLAKSDSQKINLPLFLKGYLAEEVKTNLNCHFSTDVDLFAIYGSKLDLALLIDNFVKTQKIGMLLIFGFLVCVMIMIWSWMFMMMERD